MPKEIVEAAVECHKAGAAITHIHVRDPKTGRPDFKIELFREVLEGIRERCDMILNLTTSALRLEGPESNVISQRLQPVYLKPDICSFDIGSMNFHDRAFMNSPQWAEVATKCMRENGVKPEIEVFDVGHIYQACDLIQKGLIDDPPYFQLCMGTKWGIEGSAENLLFMKSKLPSNALWSALGVGRVQLPMITMSMLLGGNVRVGFEDNIYLRKGVLAKNNAQIVEMVVDLAERLGRQVATSNEARKILGIKNIK
jgi:3-keto-5-aminohexanoate cleavage enzyme